MKGGRPASRSPPHTATPPSSAPPTSTSAARKLNDSGVLIHPTVLCVLHFLYHLPAIRCAVWEAELNPPDDVTKEDLLASKFIRVLQYLFLKIHRGDVWSMSDQEWSRRIVDISGNVSFDMCRNYMLALLIVAIPDLDDLFAYTCEQEIEYPEIGLAESRPLPDLPLTFGCPANNSVELELRVAGMLGFGSLQPIMIGPPMSNDVRNAFASIGRKDGDQAMCLTGCRYERYHFPPVLVTDRWPTHPCTPTARSENSGPHPACVRVSPDPQLRPAMRVDIAPLFPWAYDVDNKTSFWYSLYSIAIIRGFEWAENFAEGIPIPGSIPTAMGTYVAFINTNMSGNWIQIDRMARPITESELIHSLLSPNALVLSYTYISDDQRATLFPPPSTIEVPPILLSRRCGNPTCNKEPAESTTFLVCSKCHLVGYCTPQCQKDHWKSHRRTCSSTAVVADISIPTEPILSIRPPFGRNCKFCQPAKAQRDLEYFSSLPHCFLMHHAAMLFPGQPRDQFEQMSTKRLARKIFEAMHPAEAIKNNEKKKKANAKTASSKTEPNHKKEKKRKNGENNEKQDSEVECSSCDDEDDKKADESGEGSGEEEEDEEEEESELSENEEELAYRRKLAARAALRKRQATGSTKIARWALPVAVVMVGVLMAISWGAFE